MKTIFTLLFTLAISFHSYSQACDSLLSPCVSTFSRNGYYFNLEAISDVTINGISYLVQNSGTRDISLYYRQGTYFGFEGVASNWTYIGTDSIVTPDFGLSCPIPHQPLGIDFTMCIPQGQVYGFYIVMSSGVGTLEGHTNFTEGSIGAQDAYLKLITGKGQFGIGDFSGTLTVDLTFQGAIQYDCLCVTSVDEKQSADAFSVFPNPAVNQLTISNGQLAIHQIEISDVSGRKIISLQQTIPKLQTLDVDVSLLSKGIYFLKIYSVNGIQTKKFIKE